MSLWSKFLKTSNNIHTIGERFIKGRNVIETNEEASLGMIKSITSLGRSPSHYHYEICSMDQKQNVTNKNWNEETKRCKTQSPKKYT